MTTLTITQIFDDVPFPWIARDQYGTIVACFKNKEDAERYIYIVPALIDRNAMPKRLLPPMIAGQRNNPLVRFCKRALGVR